jgi:hypothetical protein
LFPISTFLLVNILSHKKSVICWYVSVTMLRIIRITHEYIRKYSKRWRLNSLTHKSRIFSCILWAVPCKNGFFKDILHLIKNIWVGKTIRWATHFILFVVALLNILKLTLARQIWKQEKNILKCQKLWIKNSRLDLDILSVHIKFCENLIFLWLV